MAKRRGGNRSTGSPIAPRIVPGLNSAFAPPNRGGGATQGPLMAKRSSKGPRKPKIRVTAVSAAPRTIVHHHIHHAAPSMHALRRPALPLGAPLGVAPRLPRPAMGPPVGQPLPTPPLAGPIARPLGAPGVIGPPNVPRAPLAPRLPFRRGPFGY